MINSKIVALADKLVAGFGTDLELANTMEEMSIEDARKLDALVFECQGCNHWFRQCDNATPDAAEWYCGECA